MVTLDVETWGWMMKQLLGRPPKHAGERFEIVAPIELGLQIRGRCYRSHECVRVEVEGVRCEDDRLGWKLPEMRIDFGHDDLQRKLHEARTLASLVTSLPLDFDTLRMHGLLPEPS